MFRETAETRYRPTDPRFEPRYSVDDTVRADLYAIGRAEHELARFTADETTARRMLREALVMNSFGTVSIEGNPITLTEVRSLLAEAPAPTLAAGPSERDVLNIARFLDRLDHEGPPSGPGDLERLHAALFEGTVRSPGRFKVTQNFIGRHRDRVVVYVPTPPERVRDEIDRALEWFSAADEHPLVRVAIFFHELQSIYPFEDGNGRLGRALAALQLYGSGYRSVRYATVDFAIDQDRDAYYDALAVPQGGAWDLTPWIRYFLRNLRLAFDDAVQRFLFLGAVPVGLDGRALDVAMWIARRDRVRPGRRLMLNDIHAAFPMIPRRTLQRDLRALVDAGVVALEGRGRGARYSLHPVFRPAPVTPTPDGPPSRS